jgi:hypothetical protein
MKTQARKASVDVRFRNSLAAKLSAKQRADLLDWAHRSMKGLDESHVFCGILDDRPLDVSRVEFLIQLGHAILNDKVLIFPVPHGVKLPKKLEAVADRIIRYNPKDLETLQHGLEKALTEIGAKVQ